MPLRQGETVPQMIVRVAREQGLDARATKIALAIAAQESKFDPQAEGDWSASKKRMRSIGLFQLNEEGLGAGMGDERYDPEANANRGIANLKAAYAKHGALSDGDIAYLAQRPADRGAYVTSINGKTGGSDRQWAGTIQNAMGGMAQGGQGGDNSAPVFPIAGKTLANTTVTTQHGAKGTNTGYAGVPESHRGMDLSANRGAQVVAPVSGVVTTAHKWNGSKEDPYGNWVEIKGDDGKSYRFAHLQELNVKQGDKIGQTTLLGTVDSTGNSSGDHLHFEEIVNGQAVNPQQTLSGAGSAAGGTRVAGDTTQASALVTALEQQIKDQAARVKSATVERDQRQVELNLARQRAKEITAQGSKASQSERASIGKTGTLTTRIADLEAEIPTYEERVDANEKVLGELQRGLASAKDQAAGRELDPSQKEQNEASAAQARATAAKIESEVSQSKDPNSPDNQYKLSQAALLRKQADNYDAAQKADNALKAGQTASAYGSAKQSEAQADYIRGTLESTVKTHLAQAGLNDAQAKSMLEKLQPEINQIVATTAKIRGDADYTRALTEAVTKKLPLEIAKFKSDIGLTDAQANDLTAKLPGALVLQGTQARLDQAQAAAQSGSALTSLATAHKTQFEMQMESWKAGRQQELQKLMSRPGVSSQDIAGFLMGSATNATEMINAFNADIERQKAEETSRASHVRESIDIQNADESMRNNIENNITSFMNARTNQQNAATTAIGPMLGGLRVANALGAQAPLMGQGDAAIKKIAQQMGVGQGVLDGVLAGIKDYQGNIDRLKSQSPTVRMANPNAQGTQFKAPTIGAGAAAGLAGGAPPPSAPNLNLPGSIGEMQGAVQPPPQVEQVKENVGLDVSGAGNTPPDQMDDTGNDLPQQPPDEPPPDEEEEEGGGGGGGGGSFRAPKGRKKPLRMERLKRQFGMFRAPVGGKKAA